MSSPLPSVPSAFWVSTPMMLTVRPLRASLRSRDSSELEPGSRASMTKMTQSASRLSS